METKSIGTKKNLMKPNKQLEKRMAQVTAQIPQIPPTTVPVNAGTGATWDTSGSGVYSSTIQTESHKQELLQVETVIDEADSIKMNDGMKASIKQNLVNILAQKMLKDDRINFTQQFDPIHNKRIFRAYTYVGDKQFITTLKNPHYLSQTEMESIHQHMVDTGYNIPEKAAFTLIGEVLKRLDNKK